MINYSAAKPKPSGAQDSAPYTVNVSKSFDKDTDSLSSAALESFLKGDWLTKLTRPFNLPPNTDIKKMGGFTSSYRVRDGEYRFIFTVDKPKRTVTLLGIGPKGGVYDERSLRIRERQILAAKGYLFDPRWTYERALPSELRKPPSAQPIVDLVLKQVPELRPYFGRVTWQYAEHDHGPEARTVGSTVTIFPKFYKLPMDVQNWVLVHEAGHVVEGTHDTMRLVQACRDAGIDPWRTESLPYSQPNMTEAFADCFAAYFLEPQELMRKYPRWVAVVESYL